MPRKSRPRKLVKPNLLAEGVWIAPRRAHTSKPLAFEPVGMVRSNRYLDFADIALGAKKSSSYKKKPHNDLSNAQSNQLKIITMLKAR